ncbi:PhzF family phenazine biosynthesis protein [Sphaerisporangium dianthi]|uniref:PhzF family phenazine biosynthesis protein n=1 Tax=Sphaerisporangium dianthi TaxID=1436120 RepID=A0ABV9CVT5_9ACTN
MNDVDRVPVSIVNACLRDGRGGSPTAVLGESAAGPPRRASPTGASPPAASLTDAERSRVPARFGTSHAVFVTRRDSRSALGAPKQCQSLIGADESTVDVRFFTTEGELPACGHGTVAAIAFLAEQCGGAEHRFRLRASGRSFAGHAVREGDVIHAAFDPGPVTLRDPTPVETDRVIAALGIASDLLAPGPCVASLGRTRMLIPITTPEAVAALAPDLDRLRAACDQLGLLGCYVHSAPTSAGRVVARMFAPSIGVPEDIANANSTACLAAHLADRGVTDLTVEMGDALGSPATITASARESAGRLELLVGGAAIITRTGTL